MALSVPKVGFSMMLKDGAKHFKGVEESIIRNIQACAELGSSLRSSFGPNGMNKMIINHLEKLFVTSDAATIVKELEVQHPAAKMIVMANQMQEQEVGDGTSLVIVLACALLENAEELLRMGLNPSEIIKGYDMAMKRCIEVLPELCCGKVDDLRNLDEARRALRTSLMSKQYGNEDFLSGLVAEACIKVLPKNTLNFNVDNIRVCKVLGSGLHGSKVVLGMLFKSSAQGHVKKMDNAKVVVYTCAFDITQTETKGTVLINTAKDLLNYSKEEEAVVEEQVKAIAAAGVNVVVSGGKFGDIYLHFLNKHKIMAVRIPSKFDLRRLCKTVGATALPIITVPQPAEIGSCSHVYMEEIGETDTTIFRQDSENGAVATILIRGATDNLMNDIERGIDDAVNTFKGLTKDNRLLPGAGATEIELARLAEAHAQTCPGLEQYAIQKYAEALETIPKILADNAGAKSTEILSKLYAAHQQGSKNIGFDNEVEGGGVRDVSTVGIFDLYHAKFWALKLASNAACTVLQVDQIICAKQAGGPKPRDAKGQDEDD